MSEDLPEGWKSEPLRNVAQVVSGGTPSRYVPEFWEKGNIPWVTPTDITGSNGRYLSDTREHITERGLQSCSARLLPPGTLLMTSRATLGEIKIAACEVCTNQGFKSLIPLSGMDNRFLFYQIALNKERYKGLGIGSTFLEVNKRDTERFEVLIAPLPRQRRIVEILSTLDEAIEQTEALIAKMQQVKAGLMHDLFTRGVTPDGRLRPTREQAPELYKESPIGWIPKEWDWDFLENLTTKIVDGVHHTPNYVEDGIPFVTVKNLTASTEIDFTELNYVALIDHLAFIRRADPKPGDVLVTKDGTLGVSRIVETWHPEFSIFVSVAQLRPIPSRVRPWLLHSFFDSGLYERQLGGLSAGSGLKHIHLEHFRRFQIPLPPPKEQDAFAEVSLSVNGKIKAEEKLRDKLIEQKKGLMQDLLNGHKSGKQAETPLPVLERPSVLSA